MPQDQIPEHFITQFDSAWRALTQQGESRLGDTVTVDPDIIGKEKSYNQIGPVEMTEITSRSGETDYTDNPLEKRWIRPRGYDVTSLEDEFDHELLGTISSPTSAIMQSHVKAYNRRKDRTIIAALGGTAYQGIDGTTPVSLSLSVAVDFLESGATANSGLTIGKIRQAKYLLDNGEVDDEDRFFVYAAKQLQNLLATTETTSTDYNTVKALVAGQIDTFLGFKFRRTQLLPIVAASGVRTCYAYHKSGLQFADGGRKSHMDILPTRKHSLQARSVAKMGATRMEEEKVVAVLCDEVL